MVFAWQTISNFMEVSSLPVSNREARNRVKHMEPLGENLNFFKYDFQYDKVKVIFETFINLVWEIFVFSIWDFDEDCFIYEWINLKKSSMQVDEHVGCTVLFNLKKVLFVSLKYHDVSYAWWYQFSYD